MIPYILEIEEFSGTSKSCLFCVAVFAKGYCYNQITFPNNTEVKYNYNEIRGKLYVCEDCHNKEDETKTIHNEMERWAKVQVGFEEFPPEILKEHKDEPSGL